jgi:hypothetical protein
VSEDYIGLEGAELLSARVLLACSCRSEANVDTYIATLDPPKLFEPLSERHQACPHFRIAFSVSDQHTNPTHRIDVLRSRSERPSRRCAADKRDEMPSPHESPFTAGNLPLLAALCSTAIWQRRRHGWVEGENLSSQFDVSSGPNSQHRSTRAIARQLWRSRVTNAS